MSEFLYEVGDEFEGSPIQQSRFITEVLQNGGLVGIDGNIVRILYLPGKGSIFDDETPKTVVVNYVSDAELVEAVVEESTATTVAEAVDAIEEIVEEVVEAAVEVAAEVAIEVVEETPKPAPKRAGRPRKTTVEE